MKVQTAILVHVCTFEYQGDIFGIELRSAILESTCQAALLKNFVPPTIGIFFVNGFDMFRTLPLKKSIYELVSLSLRQFATRACEPATLLLRMKNFKLFLKSSYVPES